jgi:hypothetical protein
MGKGRGTTEASRNFQEHSAKREDLGVGHFQETIVGPVAAEGKKLLGLLVDGGDTGPTRWQLQGNSTFQAI